jgi:CRISPR-associated endonuclease/helicase Cas3
VLPPSLGNLAARMSHLQAKSGDGSPLLNHLCDVCGQASQFLAIYRPEWPPEPEASLHRVLAYASLMHDFGKVHPRFQAALQPNGPRFRNRHEVLSLAFLAWLDLPAAEFRWIAASIATHHRGWHELRDRFMGDTTSEDTDLGKLSTGIPTVDAALLHEILRHAQEIFAYVGWSSFEPYPLLDFVDLDYGASISRAFSQVDCLMQAIKAGGERRRPGAPQSRDWRPILAAIHARGWLLTSDHLASFQVNEIRSAIRARSAVDDMYPDFIWKPHQMAVGEYRGSALLIAPTGSGKTEAALRWAARQAESGTHGRLCILLPYQTSLNAMQKRLIERLDSTSSAHPERWNQTVSLLHGRSARYLYESFLKLDYAPSEAQKSAKDQNELARLFAAPLAVSTVFSVIRLLFATRGPERLMVAFSGARIVVDEIHAYAPEVTALTLAALVFLKRHLGAQVLFMSATVPDHLKRVLASSMGILPVPEQPPWAPNARHRLTLLPFDSQSEDAIRLIIEASRRGSVLVVVNQVRRAIQLWDRLRQDVRSHLLHSRYHFADRAAIESRIQPQSGVVLVATQAVEVSLDLDFDACFSEMAPIESVVQRFGRCNRRGLHAPSPVFVFLKFPEGVRPHLPYSAEHLIAVANVLKEFCQQDETELTDSAVDVLLNRSYPADLKVQLEQQIREKAELLQKLFVDDWKPFGLESSKEREALEEQWASLFDGNEVLPEVLIPDARAQGSWLGAARYLVPIAGRQYRQFANQIDWNEELSCNIIRRPYGAGGLDLHSRNDL